MRARVGTGGPGVWRGYRRESVGRNPWIVCDGMKIRIGDKQAG